MKTNEVTVSKAALTEIESLIEKTKRFYDQQIAGSTRKFYQSDWMIYQRWCKVNKLNYKELKTAALFISAKFEESLHPSTLTRRVAAIRFWFNEYKISFTPQEDKLLHAVLKGIKRDDKAKPIQPKKALPIKALKQMVDQCEHSLRGIRDKAIILLGFGGSFRRSELVNLNIEDITFVEKGALIHIKKSKTDQEAKGYTKPIILADNKHYCPVLTLKKWIEAANITEGILFKGIRKNDLLRTSRLTSHSIYQLIQSYAFKAGYELTDFSPHSLRSGLNTAALENGALPSKLMNLNNHANLKSLQHYVLHAEFFKQHPAEGLL